MTNLFSRTSIAAVLALASAAGVATAQAGEFSAARIVKPKAGLSLAVGSKQAVGYFTAERGGCALTVLVGEAGEDAAAQEKMAAPSRFSTFVTAGRTARIDTEDGPSLEFFCSTGASFLTTRVIDRVAYSGGSAE